MKGSSFSMVKQLSRAVPILRRIFRRLDDIRMTNTSDTERRAAWLRVLARARPEALAALADPVLADWHFEHLRQPEQGLVMLRSRIGQSGDRFNLGEATLTRCTVRLRLDDGQLLAGVGHVLGGDGERAERVAKLDALLQAPQLHSLLWQTVVAPLHAQDEARQREELARTEATRVRFFALQPETAP
jgi:alpha-D-ribose 1-methylphosphonate 5-triphosphate synthase subunit PhnG